MMDKGRENRWETVQQRKKQQQEEIETLYKEGKLFRDIKTVVENARPIESLWGYILFKKAITGVVGDPGVCKTTFGYAMCAELARGDHFLDIKPEHPVKVLYCDFESDDSLITSRVSLIDRPMENIVIYNLVDFLLPDIAGKVIELAQQEHIDLIVVDNQSTAFNTTDENDNAEAIRQTRFVRRMAQMTDTAILVYHHTSKANAPGIRKGSGAFARARLADVMVNINDVGRNVVQLEVVKNRLCDEPICWYLEKVGGKFTFTDPPLGVSGARTDTQIYKAQELLLETADRIGTAHRKDLLSAAASQDGQIEERILLQGIYRLTQLGKLRRTEFGMYESVHSVHTVHKIR